MVAEEIRSQFVFRVDDGQRLEHAAGLLRLLGPRGAEHRAGEDFGRGNVADDVVPSGEAGVASCFVEGLCGLADAQRAEVVAAHGGRGACAAARGAGSGPRQRVCVAAAGDGGGERNGSMGVVVVVILVVVRGEKIGGGSCRGS